MRSRTGTVVMALAIVVMVASCSHDDTTDCTFNVVDQAGVTLSTTTITVGSDHDCVGTVRVRALRDSVGTDPRPQMMYFVEPAEADSVGTDPRPGS